ncbi:hypothetical protein CONPUDRAFT_166730 [Coniophora puteana RWD-64-598 SS2]|uniref:Uncharacterized protein n=1 Tax=Coniophora puteana (strain RWD-64-598) TaxID=741705 RepID=A0A5M3MHZ8_CONPW|nr:uncharacterized protein CONPUDRAFT_166730 [Coniophora puteana RWD-64-598 SS2]EIW78832.1 hypothetical protein CONPUDRAFT_166730 [Coniophora puteana RWD-64-598 SS2]
MPFLSPSPSLRVASIINVHAHRGKRVNVTQRFFQLTGSYTSFADTAAYTFPRFPVQPSHDPAEPLLCVVLVGMNDVRAYIDMGDKEWAPVRHRLTALRAERPSTYVVVFMLPS